MIKPELLAPAGDLEKLKIAIIYGADAVFIGGQEYGLRANASNFSINEIKEACEFAHSHSAKIYVTTNIFFHDENVDGFISYIKSLEEAGVDALITADLVAIELIKEHTNLEIHLSTQQSVMNHLSVQLFKQLGVSRIVLARECSKQEILDIKNNVDIEIEIFVHGSMCIGYSGRCMLSNHMTARDANRGGCSQNCRWEYELKSDEVNISKENGMFSMNPDDLTLINQIKSVCDLNIESIKVEGRMRSIYYIANVINVYRRVIDKVYNNSFDNDEKYYNELLKSANRFISEQYFDEIPSYKKQNFGGRDEKPSKEFCGLVLDANSEYIKLEQRNYFKKGDTIEFIRPKMESVSIMLDDFYDENMNLIDVARHPQQIIYIPSTVEVFENCMARLI